jgi:hypothetical protein
MFRWYRNSELCYVFLSDVDADENPYSRQSMFRQARWFSRGWTLQELIAPGVVYFYGLGWKQIGSREGLLPLIVQRTQINTSYFATGDLTKFSAAQKMSWAAGRRTTRPEDMAYCLLGLFDINMPLLYSLLAHSESDILAESPDAFVGCADFSRISDSSSRFAEQVGFLLNRNLSLTRTRITMAFPIVKLSSRQAAYPSGRSREGTYVVAALNCFTLEGRCTLKLGMNDSGTWSKTQALKTEEAVEASEVLGSVESMTLSIERAKSSDGDVWRWRYRPPAFWRPFSWLAAQSLQSQPCSPIMTAIEKPVRLGPGQLRIMLADLGGKVVVRGPSDRSGFAVRYVHVGKLLWPWLQEGDEVHLVPSSLPDQGAPCVVFSSAEGWSFLVALEPTRASVNANLYTDIPPWEGEEVEAYIKGLERTRGGDKGETPSRRATQQADGGGVVVVKVQSRRRSNGWWVHVTVAPSPEEEGAGPEKIVPVKQFQVPRR